MTRGKNEGDFREVRKDHPCPVCEKSDWCVISGDGLAAICMRVEGGEVKQFKNGQLGYLYRLDGLRIEAPPPPVNKKKAKRIENALPLARSMAAHSEAPRKRAEVARELGVSLAVLEDMLVGVGWDDWGGREFASFPCWGADGKCRGIIMRYPGGKKLTVPGTSNSGVFVPRYWWLRPGPIFIVEGASDVAALASCNIAAIGRPSAAGGADVVISMLQRRGLTNREILVVMEYDAKEHFDLTDSVRARHDEKCQGCLTCWPGMFGALSCVDKLQAAGFASRMVCPMEGKDVRATLNADLIPEWLELAHAGAVSYVKANDIGGRREQ